MRTESAGGGIEIKLPQRNEVIVSPIYRICVAAPFAAGAVELSIDEGPWRACVKEIGYWWYDWLDYKDGEHRVVARTRGKRGRWLTSVPRELLVDVLMKRRSSPGRSQSLPEIAMKPKTPAMAARPALRCPALKSSR
jgi:hypothetical protein